MIIIPIQRLSVYVSLRSIHWIFDRLKTRSRCQSHSAYTSSPLTSVQAERLRKKSKVIVFFGLEIAWIFSLRCQAESYTAGDTERRSNHFLNYAFFSQAKKERVSNSQSSKLKWKDGETLWLGISKKKNLWTFLSQLFFPLFAFAIFSSSSSSCLPTQ